jgi:3-phytase
MDIKIISTILGIFLIFACNQKSSDKLPETERRGLENEDFIELEMVRSFQDKINNSVMADIETTPVSAESLEDAADDPAIWYNSSDPGQSVVYGSNKRGGIIAYDLEGNEIKFYPVGNVNNIDILDSLSSSNEKVQLLGCSNRSTQSIDLFFIEKDGSLKPARKYQWRVNPSEIDDVYGFCFGKDLQSGTDYLFVNGKNGRMEQYALQFQADTIELKRTRIVQFDDQTEGMVVDNETGTLYVGAENTGIWKLSIQSNSNNEKQLISSSTSENKFIKFDIEGLSLMNYDDQTFLLASSQGNYSYAIFNLSDDDRYLSSFKIIGAHSIDGVEETDGIGVSMDSLSPKFPKGIFVAQDGYNFYGDTLLPQNFKYVSMQQIHSILDDL